jgi:hypothetical protein
VSKRAWSWVAFVVVHVLLIAGEFVFGKAASWDVDQMYRWWADTVILGAGVPGVTQEWVYPAFALVPMLLSRVIPFVDYTLSWGLLITAVDALAFAMLLGRGRSRGRLAAAWFWLAGAAALGGVGMFRLDALTVPAGIAGGLWLVGRPWLGAGLLAAAAWLKVWPAAMLVAAFVAVRRRWAVVGGAVGVSLVIMLAVIALGGGAYLFSFVGDQTARGLQIEAPVSTVYLWLAVLGDPAAWVYYDQDMITFQVTGPQVDTVIAAMTPLMALAMAVIAGVGAVAAWRGAGFVRLFPMLSLALVLAFVVFNKVGSPQYMTWLIPPVVVGLVVDRRRWRTPAIVVAVLLAMTQVIFPWFYDALLALSPAMVVVLTLRNAALAALLLWAVVRLVGVARAGARRSARHLRPSLVDPSTP